MINAKFARWNLYVILAAIVLILFFLDPIGRTGDWQRMLARMHPAMVHLPIGMLIGALFLAVLGRLMPGGFVPGRGSSVNTGSAPDAGIDWLLLLGSWASLKAAVAGTWLARMGGYELDTLMLHRNLGLLITMLAAALLWIRFTSLRTRATPVFWAGLVIVLIVGGDMGGRLTHGDRFASEYAPDFLRTSLGWEDPIAGRFKLDAPDSTTVYDGIVAPILEQKCSSCHGAERNRGRLRLHTAEAIASSEGDEPLIVAGKPDESEMIKRITLPEGHEDQMPPSLEARPISHADVELLKWWVAEGASFDATISQTPIPTGIETILAAYGLGEIKRGVFALSVPMPDSMLLGALANSDVQVTRVAEDSPFLEIRCEEAACLKADAVQSLADNIISIDLTGSNATDDDVRTLSQFPHLVRLDVSRTSVNGSGFDALANLEYLTYLNAYGSRLTDDAFDNLVGLKTLTAVYLWQTAVSAEGAARLRDALPNAEVDDGR